MRLKFPKTSAQCQSAASHSIPLHPIPSYLFFQLCVLWSFQHLLQQGQLSLPDCRPGGHPASLNTSDIALLAATALSSAPAKPEKAVLLSPHPVSAAAPYMLLRVELRTKSRGLISRQSTAWSSMLSFAFMLLRADTDLF